MKNVGWYSGVEVSKKAKKCQNIQEICVLSITNSRDFLENYLIIGDFLRHANSELFQIRWVTVSDFFKNWNKMCLQHTIRCLILLVSAGGANISNFCTKNSNFLVIQLTNKDFSRKLSLILPRMMFACAQIFQIHGACY